MLIIFVKCCEIIKCAKGLRPDEKELRMQKKPTKKETSQYIEFLEKRLDSENYKANVSAEEYEKTKEKLKKARLRIKLL